MSEALEKPQAFNPADAVNAIRDRIRGAMLDIIPTAQWDALIKAEMDAFMTDRTERTHYGETRTVPAGFKVIVRKALEEDAQKRVKELLDSPEWKSRWRPDGNAEVGEAVQEYITKHSG